MVWILLGLTINLIIVFLDSTHLPLLVMESIKNEKEIRRPLPNSINVIMYMEFENDFFVDKTRHIMKD